METGKKDWTRPELIIMVRNKPEEAVLSVCKVMDELGPGEPGGDGEIYHECDISGDDGATPCYDPSPS